MTSAPQPQRPAPRRPPSAHEGLYGASLALLTDLYQLTMAQGYWQHGMADRTAAFNLYFRKAPFGGEHALACGLGPALDYLESFRLCDDDLAYLRRLEAPQGGPLFDPTFLDALEGMTLELDVDAVPEGTVVFPNEPILRVEGPMLQAQLLETALLTHINFATLIATKAARICAAAQGDPVLEFGLRRAQGIDGGVTASRAAYVGGCAATSNVLAGRLFGIPVRGTHAHSWVMAHDDERAAFDNYAAAMPRNCVLLVDTYDTDTGIARAVEVGLAMRRAGHELAGIRLDSGDLAAQARRARAALDAAGLTQVAIVASNDLDEAAIGALKAEGAPIGVWGVGTRLVTGHDQPALGGVYKLAAFRVAPDAPWRYAMKASADPNKASLPGRLQVRRHVDGDGCLSDQIYDVDAGIEPGPGRAAAGRDLLVPVLRRGARVGPRPSLEEVRATARRELETLARCPESPRVEIAPHLHERRRALAEVHDAQL